MATVIFSNAGDNDTAVLRALWKGLNAKVIEVNHSTFDANAKVDRAIAEEEDLLIMCGHGSPSGLFNMSAVSMTRRYGRDVHPASPSSFYLISSRNVHLIKAKRIIGMWCYASEFAKSVGLNGFFTYMFISNKGEAAANQIYGVDNDTIWREETLFCNRVNEMVHKDIPQDEWISRLQAVCDISNPVVVFNHRDLYYSPVRFDPPVKKFENNQKSLANFYSKLL